MSDKSTAVGDEVQIDYLADTWQRVKWANRDGTEFSAISKWFAEEGAYAVHVQREGDRWQASWHRFIDADTEAEKFDELSRLLGSFLDHGRAALNYATYQLAHHAIREDPTLKGDLIPESVEFPIFDDPERFKKDNRIKKLPEKYWLAVENVQPYDGSYPGLWLLHELAREFRHRVVHPMAVLPAESLYHVIVNGELVHPDDLEIVSHERLEHGDVVMRFTLDTDDPSPDVHPRVTITIGIDHILCRNLVGVGVLNQIRADTQTAIDTVEALIYPTT
jgi:hypothetical protein